MKRFKLLFWMRSCVAFHSPWIDIGPSSFWSPQIVSCKLRFESLPLAGLDLSKTQLVQPFCRFRSATALFIPTKNRSNGTLCDSIKDKLLHKLTFHVDWTAFLTWQYLEIFQSPNLLLIICRIVYSFHFLAPPPSLSPHLLLFGACYQFA